MRLHEEFVVAEPVAAVWKFFEQPESVAGCVPGVEYVSILDDDNVQVRATQRVGPMSATFDAKVTVLERVPGELIRFRATGRSVRGAIGNVRTENTVQLRGFAGGTSVTVDADLVLAGALGSVGQKVIAKQGEQGDRRVRGQPPAGAQRRGAHTGARRPAWDRGRRTRAAARPRVPRPSRSRRLPTAGAAWRPC